MVATLVSFLHTTERHPLLRPHAFFYPLLAQLPNLNVNTCKLGVQDVGQTYSSVFGLFLPEARQAGLHDGVGPFAISQEQICTDQEEQEGVRYRLKVENDVNNEL